MNAAYRTEAQPAFVLHSYAYRETSLIIDVFSRNSGRVALVARGARRPKSVLRGVLMAFQPLSLAWFGKNELKTLHSAEWQGGLPQMAGLPLICAFYLNELLLHLLPKEDPHEGLFMDYQNALLKLSKNIEVAPTLRDFELRMLNALGYGLELQHESEGGQPINPELWYRYEPRQGPVVIRGRQDERSLRGATLLNMAAGVYPDAETLQQAKMLMRAQIGQQLGDRSLHSRQLLRDLSQL